MRNRILQIVGIYFSFTTFCNSADYHFFASTDGNLDLQRHTVSYIPKDFGVAVNKTNYYATNVDKQTYGVHFLANTIQKKYSLNGSLGLGQGDKTYVQGDLTGTYNITPSVGASIGLFSDLIDGARAVPKEISYIGVLGALEYNSNDKYGIVGGIKELSFSDGNHREELFAKPWVSIYDGVNAYITVRDYTNTLPFTGNYFSPDKYNRSGAGIRYRFVTFNTRISGFIEQTQIKTSFASEPALAWKIQAEKHFKDLRFIASYGSDVGAMSGFKYQYVNLAMRINF